MLLWPAVALSGFLLLVAVVVALGTMSTNRYEKQRKREGFTRPARSPSQVPGPPARGQQATSTSPAFMAGWHVRVPVRRRDGDVARDVAWRNADWMTDTVPIVP